MLRRSLPWLLLALGALAVAFAPSLRAEDQRPHHIVSLHVTGEGSTAKAWYRGAPAIGEPVQDALDKLSAQGYRVASVSAADRSTVTLVSSPAARETTLDPSYLILLER